MVLLKTTVCYQTLRSLPQGAPRGGSRGTSSPGQHAAGRSGLAPVARGDGPVECEDRGVGGHLLHEDAAGVHPKMRSRKTSRKSMLMPWLRWMEMDQASRRGSCVREAVTTELWGLG